MVRKQPITKAEFESGKQEVLRLKEGINQGENKVRSKDEAIRNTEKRIQACREEISRTAE
jgi:hypothetical protein